MCVPRMRIERVLRNPCQQIPAISWQFPKCAPIFIERCDAWIPIHISADNLVVVKIGWTCNGVATYMLFMWEYCEIRLNGPHMQMRHRENEFFPNANKPFRHNLDINETKRKPGSSGSLSARFTRISSFLFGLIVCGARLCDCVRLVFRTSVGGWRPAASYVCDRRSNTLVRWCALIRARACIINCTYTYRWIRTI